MSWGTGTADAVAKDAIEVAYPQLSDVVADEQRAQVDAALEAARLLAQAVGRPEDGVMVTMSGHANPGHGPRDGWANEMISISVTARPVT